MGQQRTTTKRNHYHIHPEYANALRKLTRLSPLRSRLSSSFCLGDLKSPAPTIYKFNGTSSWRKTVLPSAPLHHWRTSPTPSFQEWCNPGFGDNPFVPLVLPKPIRVAAGAAAGGPSRGRLPGAVRSQVKLPRVPSLRASSRMMIWARLRVVRVICSPPCMHVFHARTCACALVT